MLNNKGQTLVIFVVVLPILMIILASIVDISFMYMENNKLNSINELALNYGLDNINQEDLSLKIKELINANDNEININQLTIKNNEVYSDLSKDTNSIFGKIIGIDKYKIVSKYKGIIKENKKEITKG